MTLIIIVTLVTVCVILALLAVPSLFLVHTNLGSRADQVGLQAALMLNKGNRIGEINEMTAHSRELVYTCRQTHNTISQRYRHLEPLASKLMEEARRGAKLVAEERQFLSGTLTEELRSAMGQESRKAVEAGTSNMVLFELKKNGIDRIELGYVSDIPSNAVCPVAVPELRRLDKEKSLMLGASDFYRGNVSAPLPLPDADLNFEFASLPPMIKNSISQARLISSNDFVKQLEIRINQSTAAAEEEKEGKKFQQQSFCLPSAVRVVSTVNAGTKKMNHDISISSIASATGSQRADQ